MTAKKEDVIFSGGKYNDYASFSRLFDRYYSRLCAYVYEITKSKDAAEDIVQEVFIKIWKRRDKLEIRENILSYLFKATRNAALNYLRNEATRLKIIENYPTDISSINHDFLEEQEFVSFVQDCIEELPERSRQVFLMSRFDGYKQKEIADQLGTSVKTIKNQIWKSLQYLKSCLEYKDAL